MNSCVWLSAVTIAVRRQMHGCDICSSQANLPFAELIVSGDSPDSWTV